MASVLAIVSKAMFEREAKRAGITDVGKILDVDRYVSKGAGLAPLREGGGSLVLVTVRPPDERVWLVGILDEPKLAEDGYVATVPNAAPITDVTTLLRELLQASKLNPAPGKLGMSLQTPRRLPAGWLERFRAAAGFGATLADQQRRLAELAAQVATAGGGAVATASANAGGIALAKPDADATPPALAHPATPPSPAPSCDPARLPAPLVSPPWGGPTLRPPSPRARAYRRDLRELPTRIVWPGFTREEAIASARPTACRVYCTPHWLVAARAEVTAAFAKRRVCARVLTTLPPDDAIAVARAALETPEPALAFCGDVARLLPAMIERLGEAIVPFALRVARTPMLRAEGFAALLHVGTPAAVPTVIEVLSKDRARRAAALQWLRTFPDEALAALVPLAAGVEPEALGLADVAVHGAEPTRRAAVVALRAFASDDRGRAAIDACARALALEAEVRAALDVHPLAGKKPPKIPPLPAVRPRIGGAPLGDDALTAYLELLAITDWSAPTEDVDDVERALDAASVVPFLESLLAAFFERGALKPERWIFDAACQLGGGALLGRASDLVRSWRSRYGLSSAGAIEAMGRAAVTRAGRGGDRALEELRALSVKAGSADRERAAEAALVASAEALGVSRGALDDRLVPRLGLDESGRMPLEIGGRKLLARLDVALVPFLTDAETGERLAEAPRTATGRRGMRAVESQDQIELAKWDQLKRDVPPVAEALAQRAERWMYERARWSAEDFGPSVLGHPVVRDLARGIVWGAYDGARLVGTFRVSEDGTYAGPTDDTFALAPSLEVGVAHPAELDDATLKTWSGVLFDYEIIPAFDQLGVKVHRIEPGEAASTRLARWPGRALDARQLTTLRHRGWLDGPAARGEPADAVARRSIERRATLRSGAPALAVLLVAPPSSKPREVEALVLLPHDVMGFDGGLAWSEADPVSISLALGEIAQVLGQV